jgi:hypothetical protein
MPVQLHALRECCIPRALRPAIQPACLPARLQALKRKLAARKSFVPWGGGKFVPLQLKMPPREPLLLEEVGPVAPAPAPAAGPPPVVLPPGIEPLVLWEPPAGAEGQPVLVDDMLTQVGFERVGRAGGGQGARCLCSAGVAWKARVLLLLAVPVSVPACLARCACYMWLTA